MLDVRRVCIAGFLVRSVNHRAGMGSPFHWLRSGDG